MSSTRFRIRFRKAGDIRFLSHHDLMRLFERMMRRADLPFKQTEGFHPKPKMAFASALGLGIVGLQEVVEIEFIGEWSADDVNQRLADQCPAGLHFTSFQVIAGHRSAQVCRAGYRVELPEAEVSETLQPRIDELMVQAECWIERTKPERRRIDIRPYLLHLELAAENVGAGNRSLLVIELAVTPNGSARPEDVLQLLGLTHVLTNGAVIERHLLELHDETESHTQTQTAENFAAPTWRPFITRGETPRRFATELMQSGMGDGLLPSPLRG